VSRATILLRPKCWAKYSFGPWLTVAARRLHRNILTMDARIGDAQTHVSGCCLLPQLHPQIGSP